ncbi:MAG: hypothetical protein M1813_006786 [Trichoglossum hirsutum]|nr:MAG: hypothetical protein M1813_006786 [Trichoglossum hirsutum]
MSTGTEQTFQHTKEDVRKLESRGAKLHGGGVPADSEASIMKSIVDSKSNPDIIAERQANLPLPEQPPMPSDWNSADQRAVNVDSGRFAGDVSYGNGQSGLRSPATGDSALRVDGQARKKETSSEERVGRQGKDELEGLPRDAVTRDASWKV